MRRSILHIADILKWADAHRRRTGRFPQVSSGVVVDAPEKENWRNLDNALRLGLRGLRPGSSLARLFAQHRDHRNRKDLPPYQVKGILHWADAWRERTGKWPTNSSGPIPEAPGETWMAVDMALRHSQRGMPGGSSLAQLLAKQRKARNSGNLPRLTIKQILAWADAHKKRNGNWPTSVSGRVVDSPVETWRGVDKALRNRGRGLSSISSLFKLLAKHRGVTRHVRKPSLTERQILQWMDLHKKRTGVWPDERSGPIAEAPGETWGMVQKALRHSKRGLTRRSTLAKLLAEYRGVRNMQDLPRLTLRQVCQWIKAWGDRHGRRPTRNSGPIPGTHGETWCGVDVALKQGHRGLDGGSSLSRLSKSLGDLRA
jgi:hypothetical protein